MTELILSPMKCILMFLLFCSCATKEDPPQKGFSPYKTDSFDSTLVWDISSVATSREERITFLLNQDSAFRHKKEKYLYDGRFKVHHTNVSTGDTVWYENGEKEVLLQKMKKLSIAFPNTSFFVFSFEVNYADVSWSKKQGYSLWFKEL